MEWLHKAATLTADDPETGAKEGGPFSRELLERLLREEYDKLLKASNRDVYPPNESATNT